jgi:hypothetical protein
MQLLEIQNVWTRVINSMANAIDPTVEIYARCELITMALFMVKSFYRSTYIAENVYI